MLNASIAPRPKANSDCEEYSGLFADYITSQSRTDYAIIGSGVTGCSVAKTLLNDPRSGPNSVTILEARTLCSSATGRNGGHLVSPVPGEFTKYVSAVGIDMAVKIARFCNATLEKMHKLAAESDDFTKQAAEVRRTTSVIAFTDQHMFDECKESVEMYMKHAQEGRGSYKTIDGKYAKEVRHAQWSVWCC